MPNHRAPFCLSVLALSIILGAGTAHADYVLRQPLSNPGGNALVYTLAAYSQTNAPLSSGYGFGSVLLPHSSTGAIQVKNTGTGVVTLSSAGLAGDAEFSSAAGSNACAPGLSLAPGAACFGHLNFAPTGAASYAAVYTVTGNHGVSLTVPITGTGTAGAALNAFDTLGNPLTGAVSFGNVQVNQAYAGDGWAGRISNTGSAVALISGGSLQGSAAFTLKTGGVGNCAGVTSIAPGSYCNVYADFAPTSAGTHAATYTLAAGSISATLEMRGTGDPLAPTLGSLVLPAGLTTTALPFDLTPPTSNSGGPWSYASSNPAVATVSYNRVTPTGVSGTTTITATQAAHGNFQSGSVSALLTIAEPGPSIPQSCKQIKDANPSSTSGMYELDPDGAGATAPMQYYCDMSSDGGGWTRVAVQYEATPVAWAGGTNGSAYALSASKIPPHSQVAFGKDNNATFIDYVTWTYSTGDIPATLVTSPKTGKTYGLYRSSVGYYENSTPGGNFVNSCIAGSAGDWCQYLMVRQSPYTADPVWAYAANNANTAYRGTAMGSFDWGPVAYAWTLWVR